MSTIAYRDGILAADSQVTDQGSRVGSTTKCGELPGGHRWAFVGNLQLMWTFAKWCERALESAEEAPWDANAPSWTDNDAIGILIFPDGKVSEYEGRGWLRTDAEFFAWGSGRNIALGAMAAGKSATEAVEIACSIDVYSSGPVTTLRAAEVAHANAA
jgi:ATP-dependent protease HslVU (ClpYQ), peptidase subunit